MKELNPKDLTIPEIHRHLLGGIGPRPICFASTIDAEGRPNLSPFSFFNVFSANPPIMVFSPARSGRTGATKNTFDNILEVPEVVVNVVTYDMVHQMSLASSPFEKGINEFVKAGFNPMPSTVIKPPRVAESPVQFECKVNEVKTLGENGGAGNLIIAEVVKIHINEDVIGDNGLIDQQKIDLIGRMGGDWYCRAHGEALFEVKKPITSIGIGIDSLPNYIRLSESLNGNELGLLGSVEQLPSGMEIKNTHEKYRDQNRTEIAKGLLKNNQITEALALLLND